MCRIFKKKDKNGWMKNADFEVEGVKSRDI